MAEDNSSLLLAERLRSDIAGRAPGERLPSTRQLVETLRVSPVTVTRALAVLSNEGVVDVRPGAGTFVAQSRAPTARVDLSWQSVALGDRTISAEGLFAMRDPPQMENAISLATGYLHPTLMPLRLLASAWARAGRLPDAFDRAPAEGLMTLRAWFARTVAPGIEPRDVLITPGGQAAITSVVRAIVAPGETLLVESPTYPGLLAIAQAASIRAVPVPIDARGIVVEHLVRAFELTGARAVYLQPTFQNPTGAVLSTERRAAVLQAAAAAGAFVIEDDFARWLGHGGRTPPPLIADDREGRVICINSLTKATAPSLRIGTVIARGPVRERICALRVVDDQFVARPMQEAAVELVSRAGWERHLRTLSETLRDRAAAAVVGVAQHLPGLELVDRPLGGMHLWVRLPAGIDDLEVVASARDHGVIATPGRHFFAAEPPGAYLRLTFSGVAGLAELDEALRRLAAAVPALT
jgi:DNA-binding transcriptional MocR family regulator